MPDIQLLPCRSCARHFRSHEVRCPFCAVKSVEALEAAVGRGSAELVGQVAVFALAASGLCACRSAEQSQSTPSSSAPTAQRAAAPSTSPSVTASPTASESAWLPRAGAVYGAPPPLPLDAQGRPVRVSVTLGKVETTGAHIANAEVVTSAMRGGFRRCYERLMGSSVEPPKAIHVTIQVGKAGEVLSAKAVAAAPSKSGLMACVQQRAEASQFDIPEGPPPSSLQFSVTFQKEPAK